MIPKATNALYLKYKHAFDILIHNYNLTEPVKFAHLEIIVLSFDDRRPVLLVFG